MIVVGGDEHGLRPIGESGQQPGQLDAVQAYRHLDVADHVGRLLGQQFQRGSRALPASAPTPTRRSCCSR